MTQVVKDLTVFVFERIINMVGSGLSSTYSLFICLIILLNLSTAFSVFQFFSVFIHFSVYLQVRLQFSLCLQVNLIVPNFVNPSLLSAKDDYRYGGQITTSDYIPDHLCLISSRFWERRLADRREVYGPGGPKRITALGDWV